MSKTATAGFPEKTFCTARIPSRFAAEHRDEDRHQRCRNTTVLDLLKLKIHEREREVDNTITELCELCGRLINQFWKGLRGMRKLPMHSVELLSLKSFAASK